MKTKIKLLKAIEYANNYKLLLAPYCERIEIAGSIRRCKPEVGDIEMVCIPKMQCDLFGEPTMSILDVGLEDVKGRFNFTEVKGADKYKQFITPSGLQLDLFIVTSETWGYQFAVRTGGKDFSRLLVTPRQHGGYMPSHLKVKGARYWEGNTVIPTPEELDVLSLTVGGWVDPEDR